ncbi:purine-nucleoside phosphorylase [bacterium]|nr:purine-nucleoside phosphorylase [bacterium]
MMDKLNEAKKFLISKAGTFPPVVVVLGSGMSGVLNELDVETEISFQDIPHMHAASVQGHSGKLSIGRLGKNRVAVSRGRLHYYEGLPMPEVVFPQRAMALAGAQTFLLTNAAGGLSPHTKPMSLMLIQDHINLMGTSPLMGPNLEALGPRFPDMSNAYDPKLRALFREVAAAQKIDLSEGVYVGLHGPAYETPTEVRMYRQLGGDAVGMSSVPETIALRHMGRRVAGVSCITNLAAGLAEETLTHEEVLQNAKRAHSSLSALLGGVIEKGGLG